MGKSLGQTTLSTRLALGKFAAAAAMYSGFAIYLYLPHFRGFDRLQYLSVVNVCLASVGCYVLSRRWVGSFAGSFFAGAIYGFGPFTLGLAGFHPAAGFLAGCIPWLFCPAVFGPAGRQRWLSWLFSTLPFLTIVLFFQVAAHYRLFAIPIQTKLQLSELAGLLTPLVTIERGSTAVGFYHIPIASLIIGIFMLLVGRRFGITLIFCLGVIPAFCDSFLDVSPIIWLTIPVLCCSILIGAGMQGFVFAGFADRKWMLVAMMVMSVLSVVTLLFATKYFQSFAGLGSKYAKLLVEAAEMYILGTIAVATIFFMTRARLQLRWLRWTILCSAMAVDIFLGARFVVDKIL